MMKNIRNAIDKSLEYAIIFLMGLNVVNVLWQVFTRFILRDPSSYTEELARYLLIWVGLLAAAYIVSQKLHLAIDVLHSKFSQSTKKAVDVFIQAIMFLFAFLVMFIGGIKLVQITLYLEQISAALQIQLGYVYTILPLSGLIIMFYTTLEMIELLRPVPAVNADKAAEGGKV